MLRTGSFKVIVSLSLAGSLLAACGSSPASEESIAPATAAAPSGTPEPDERIPGRPGKLARAINDNEDQLVNAIKKWKRRGAGRGSDLVPEIRLRALYQQRITGRLSRWRELAKKVLPKLEPRAFWFYRANIRAARVLAALGGTPPDEPPDFIYRRPKAPIELKRYYTTARNRFRIPRPIMASVNFVETKFGRVLGPSSAGAKGPMQFLQSTWDQYGNGGNIWSAHDSIMGAGRYLSASGAPERMYDALHAYNPSDAYVQTILIYAEQMRRKPFRYLNYYWWQVFVRTKDGRFQMTGPGTRRWRF